MDKIKKSQTLQWSSGDQTPDKVYITKVFNYGTWQEWRDMRRRFVLRRIKDALRHPLKGQWTKRAKIFAETIFDVKLPKNSLISYEC